MVKTFIAGSVNIPKSRWGQVIPFPSPSSYPAQFRASPLVETIRARKSRPKITVEDIPPESLQGLASICDRKPNGLIEFLKTKVQLMVGGLRVEGMAVIPNMMKSEIIDAVMGDPLMAGCSSLSEFIVKKAEEVHARWSEPIPKKFLCRSEKGKAENEDYPPLEYFETGKSGLKDIL